MDSSHMSACVVVALSLLGCLPWLFAPSQITNNGRPVQKKELEDRDSLSSAPDRSQRRSNTLRPLAMPTGGSVGEPIESHNLCSIERSQSTRITSPSDRCSVCGKLHDDGLACIALLPRASGRPTNRQLTRYIHRSLAGTLPSLPQPLMY